MHCYNDPALKALLACTVLLFSGLLGTSIALCVVRRKAGAGKRLLGPRYVLALALLLLGSGLSSVTFIMGICTLNYGVQGPMQIVTTILHGLGRYIFLLVVLVTLNDMLRNHLGTPSSIFKIIWTSIMIIMGILTLANIALQSFVIGLRTGTDFFTYWDAIEHVKNAMFLNFSYYILYLASVIAAGALAMASLFSMRSKRQTGGALLGWVIALFISMIVWVVMGLISSLSGIWYVPMSMVGVVIMDYIRAISLILSFVFHIVIAKHPAWSRATSSTAQVYSSGL